MVACATIVAPSGGPKDGDPPIIVEAEPPNYSTDFQAGKVTLTFDEYVKLNNIHQNLIISPPFENKPQFKFKKKSFSFDIDDSLLTAATYTLNFGDAIVDITEGNALSNFQYVFSTGSYIDSLTVQGKVNHAFDQTGEKGILVMLYDCSESQDCDSMPYKEMPRYFSRTSSTGNFKISNVKHGMYSIFSLDDKNRNFIYDLSNERIGFLPQKINAADSIDYTLNLFEERKDQQLLRVEADRPGRIKLTFKNPVGDVIIAPLNFSAKKAWEIIEYSPERDTVYYWNTFGTDTLEFAVSDEGEKGFVDTGKVALNRNFEKAKLKISSGVSVNNTLDLGKPLELRLSQPVVVKTFNKIMLLQVIDSSTFDTLKFDYTFDDPALSKILIDYAFNADSSYKLIIPAGCFKDIYQMTNDTVTFKFKVRPLTYYGNAQLDIVFKQLIHPYIIQLIKNNKVMDALVVSPKDSLQDNTRKLTYKNLTPGKYRVRMIYDQNKNGKWDTGNYMGKEVPERVVYYPEEISIRSNWDIELKWELGE